MLNIDTLTLGNPFKDNDGNEWKITSNFSQNKKKILIELDLVEPVIDIIEEE